MNESIGRTTGPTTEGGAPGESVTHEPPPDPLDRARDARRAPRRHPDTLLSDPDARPRNIDPLDPRRPGRPTDDPLDPDGHVI